MFLDKVPFPEEEGEAPPEGDVAWLWFKPKTAYSYGSSLFAAYHPQCTRCQVYGVIDMTSKYKRCWCCGRFVRHPTINLPVQLQMS